MSTNRRRWCNFTTSVAPASKDFVRWEKAAAIPRRYKSTHRASIPEVRELSTETRMVCVYIANAFVHPSLAKKRPLLKNRNRDNLHLKYSRIRAEIKSGETKDSQREWHLFKVGYNDKDGRGIFAFALTFMPNESIRCYTCRICVSRSPCYARYRIFISWYLYSAISILYVLSCALPSRALSILESRSPQFHFGPFLLRVIRV